MGDAEYKNLNLTRKKAHRWKEPRLHGSLSVPGWDSTLTYYYPDDT